MVQIVSRSSSREKEEIIRCRVVHGKSEDEEERKR